MTKRHFSYAEIGGEVSAGGWGPATQYESVGAAVEDNGQKGDIQKSRKAGGDRVHANRDSGVRGRFRSPFPREEEGMSG